MNKNRIIELLDVVKRPNQTTDQLSAHAELIYEIAKSSEDQAIELNKFTEETKENTKELINLGKRTEKYTKSLIGLTYVLVVLTAGLLFKEFLPFMFPKVIPIHNSESQNHNTINQVKNGKENYPKPIIDTIPIQIINKRKNAP
jgi:hypothetical protein